VNHKSLSRNSRSQDRGMYLGPTEYEAGVLITGPLSSVTDIIDKLSYNIQYILNYFNKSVYV
jgi:hypothetical protein